MYKYKYERKNTGNAFFFKNKDIKKIEKFLKENDIKPELRAYSTYELEIKNEILCAIENISDLEKKFNKLSFIRRGNFLEELTEELCDLDLIDMNYLYEIIEDYLNEYRKEIKIKLKRLNKKK